MSFEIGRGVFHWRQLVSSWDHVKNRVQGNPESACVCFYQGAFPLDFDLSTIEIRVPCLINLETIISSWPRGDSNGSPIVGVRLANNMDLFGYLVNILRDRKNNWRCWQLVDWFLFLVGSGKPFVFGMCGMLLCKHEFLRFLLNVSWHIHVLRRVWEKIWRSRRHNIRVSTWAIILKRVHIRNLLQWGFTCLFHCHW